MGFTASTAYADDWGVCKDENASADTAIDACTQIIKAGRTRGSDLAIAYYNRAISYRQKNDNDSALADYKNSIRINAKYAKAFNNRGNVWKDKGDHDRAISDYNEAIRLEHRARLCEPRRRVQRQGRHQPRHRTSIRRSGSIRNIPAPTTCAAW